MCKSYPKLLYISFYKNNKDSLKGISKISKKWETQFMKHILTKVDKDRLIPVVLKLLYCYKESWKLKYFVCLDLMENEIITVNIYPKLFSGHQQRWNIFNNQARIFIGGVKREKGRIEKPFHGTIAGNQ